MPANLPEDPLDLMPEPENISPDARAVTAATLHLANEVRLLRLTYENSSAEAINKMNLEMAEAVKRGEVPELMRGAMNLVVPPPPGLKT